MLIVDDQRLFAEALMALLASEERVEIVGQANDGVEGVELALALEPTLVLMDFFMPRMDGVEAAALIRAELPDTRVLMLTGSDSPEDLLRAAEAGVSGYLNKNTLAADLVGKILEIASLAAGRSGRPRAEPVMTDLRSGR